MLSQSYRAPFPDGKGLSPLWIGACRLPFGSGKMSADRCEANEGRCEVVADTVDRARCGQSRVRAEGGERQVEPIRVGMLGCGVVGTGVARLFMEHAEPIRDRAGLPVQIQRIAVRNIAKKR